MIVDASALIALALDEPEAEWFEDRLVHNAGETAISPVNVWEVSTRLGALGDPDAIENAEGMLKDYAIRLVPVDAGQTFLAMDAQVRFGKGRHPARLNLGDCFAYALSKRTRKPLLFKGDDLSQTDVRIAR